MTMAVAVVWAGTCSSDLTPSLETSICSGCSPKKQKKKKKRNTLVANSYGKEALLSLSAFGVRLEVL